MNRYRISKKAQKDLNKIWGYTSQRSEEFADEFEDKLIDAFGFLAENPNVGRDAAFLADKTTRSWSTLDYVIIYRPEPKPLNIIAVISGRRDLFSVVAKRQRPRGPA